MGGTGLGCPDLHEGSTKAVWREAMDPRARTVGPFCMQAPEVSPLQVSHIAFRDVPPVPHPDGRISGAPPCRFGDPDPARRSLPVSVCWDAVLIQMESGFHE